MKNRVRVSVRADFTSAGEIVPIAYQDKNETVYIKGISKVQKKLITTKNFQTDFYCNLTEKNIKLIFVDNLWYLENK